MKIKIYLMLLLLVILLQSCTGRIKTVAVPSLMQKVDYNGAVISEKKHTVTLTHYTEFKHVEDKIIFTLLVQNRGRESISIGSENISMEFRENVEGSVPVKLEIQPLDDFMKDLENDYFKAEVRTISDIIKSVHITAENIKSQDTEDEGDTAQNRMESMALMFVSRFYTRTDDLNETIRVYDQLEGIVPPLVFKAQEVMPRRSVTGLIIYDLKDMDEKAEGEFNVVISIDGEEHKFVFSRSL